MATVTLLLKKNKQDTNGEIPVYLRIIKDRKTKFLAIGLKIDPELWDESKQRVKKKHPNSVRLNNFLAQKIAEAEGIAFELETEKKGVSSLAIKENIKGKTSPSFMKFFEEYISLLKDTKKLGTHDKAVAVYLKLKAYLKGRDLTFEEINYHYIKQYENYLRSKLGNKTNTVHSNLKIIRKLLNDAVREEIIEPYSNPFPRYKLSWEKSNKEFLTDEEIQRIEALELPEEHVINHHRNIYIFATYAGGLRISDVLQLKWQNFNGTHVTIITQKTKEQVSIKLPDKALNCIKKYQRPDAKPTDFIFPFLRNDIDYSKDSRLFDAISSNTAYANKNLKIIAEKAGIEKHISFHTSRHTFATRALRKGMRIEYVSKLLGHTAIKTTQVYAKIVNSELDKAMDIFND
ncbi:MAG: site-specific integrase [Saprospiraceae bacterium]|nr:site-specific integrase [Saprospiraceae bacterium]